jgi:hypothetical protein
VVSRAHIELELDRTDPIGGLLRDGRGDEHEFHGWLALISRLEAARDGNPDPEGEERSGTNVKAHR